MKKFKIVASTFIAVIILITNIFAAGGESLDIELVASQLMLNSRAIKATVSAYEASDKLDYNTSQGTRGMSQMTKYPLSENSALAIIRALEVTPLYTQYQKAATLIQLQTLENTVRLQAYEQYINLLKIDYSVSVQEQLVQSLERSFKQAEKKYNSGQISKIDYRASELNLKKAKLELQKYQRSEQTLIMMLNQAMGRPVKTTYEKLIDENIMPDTNLGELDQYLNNALSYRGEIQNNKQYLTVLKKDYDISKVSHPLDSDIFHKEFEYKIDEATNNMEIQKLNVQLETMSAYKELERKYLGVKGSEKSLELANIELSNLTNMYKQGKLSVLDYMNANISHSQSRIQTRSTQLDLWLYQKKLESATGVGPGIVKK
jgi:outer membrane protein TolC